LTANGRVLETMTGKNVTDATKSVQDGGGLKSTLAHAKIGCAVPVVGVEPVVGRRVSLMRVHSRQGCGAKSRQSSRNNANAGYTRSGMTPRCEGEIMKRKSQQGYRITVRMPIDVMASMSGLDLSARSFARRLPAPPIHADGRAFGSVEPWCRQ